MSGVSASLARCNIYIWVCLECRRVWLRVHVHRLLGDFWLSVLLDVCTLQAKIMSLRVWGVCISDQVYMYKGYQGLSGCRWFRKSAHWRLKVCVKVSGVSVSPARCTCTLCEWGCLDVGVTGYVYSLDNMYTWLCLDCLVYLDELVGSRSGATGNNCKQYVYWCLGCLC